MELRYYKDDMKQYKSKDAIFVLYPRIPKSRDTACSKSKKRLFYMKRTRTELRIVLCSPNWLFSLRNIEFIRLFVSVESAAV